MLSIVTGDLLVTLARKSDSGQYICEVINEEGVDIASSNVLVKGGELIPLTVLLFNLYELGAW